MALKNSRIIILSALVALGGCSHASDTFFPEDQTQQQAAEPQAAEQQTVVVESDSSAPPQLGTGDFTPPGVTGGATTDTFVGEKVATYRDELTQLQEALRGRNDRLQEIRARSAENAQVYHENVAAINYKLQLGTTPGNPEMTARYQTAQEAMSRIPEDIAAMNQLATEVASDSAMAAYLLDSVRSAFTLKGAVDEDHRQLRILEDETSQTIVLIERLLNELNQDITRQQSYVASEQANLKAMGLAIEKGQAFGVNLAQRASIATAPGQGQQDARMAAPSGRPLVVIRFDKPNVNYEAPLYQAISKALERKPDATFDVLAVSPSGAETAGKGPVLAAEARKYADAVVRSLTEMGLPGNRLRQNTATSMQATTSEVHVFVR